MERKDYYFRKAKQENYRSRAIYKLLQINKKYHIIKRDSDVLDIGCAPGSWLQALKLLGANVIVGIDTQQINEIKGIRFLKISAEELLTKLEHNKKFLFEFDAVLSDAMSHTSGVKEFDEENSLHLAKTSFEIANIVLKKNGNFLCKLFQGKRTLEFIEMLRQRFDFVKIIKPKASRKRSREVYIIGKKFKGYSKEIEQGALFKN